MNASFDHEKRVAPVGGEKGRLLAKLRSLRVGDPEQGHMDADQALLDYINDDEITEAFEAIGKWYA